MMCHPRALLMFMLLALPALAGCHRDMYDQPKLEPFEESTFFDDGLAMRPIEPHTIARGQLYETNAFTTGREGEQFVTELPVELDAKLLERGQERYRIFCSVCHGATGEGDGMVVRRGYQRPPTFHSERLRQMPIGHFFEVPSQGFGAMPSYASQVPVEDRWAIAAYIRVLQLSQHTPLEDISQEARKELEGALE